MRRSKAWSAEVAAWSAEVPGNPGKIKILKFMRECVCICMCVSACMCVCVHVFVCVCMSLCVHVCVIFIHSLPSRRYRHRHRHAHAHSLSFSLACALSFIHTHTVTGVYMLRTPINSDHSCRSNWMSGAKSIPPRKARCVPSRALCWCPCLAGAMR